MNESREPEKDEPDPDGAPEPQHPGAQPPPPGWSATPPPGAWPAPPPPGWSATPPPGTAPKERRFSVLAGILVGIGAFILSAIIGVSIVLASLGAYESGSGLGPVIALAVTFLIAPVAAIVMLFYPRLRPGAAGILIIFAAGWILLVGPCVVPAFVGYPA